MSNPKHTRDRYERIRRAISKGPTPGPWEPSYDKGSSRDIITQVEKYPVCMVRGIAYVGQDQYLANGHFIAACDPDTVSSLLAERDALREALEDLLSWAAPRAGTAEPADHPIQRARAALAKATGERS